MNRVFVTGANGLLGRNLIKMLAQRGYSVTALVRRSGSMQEISGSGINIVQGDLSDKERLTRLSAGCNLVAHIAANTNQALPKAEHYREANVRGTENMIEASVRNRTEKFVYVGTANTYGYGTLSEPGNEELPAAAPFTKSPYVISKCEAQRVVERASSDLNITTISPAFMVGPYDYKPGSGRVVARALGRRLIFHPSGGKSFVHVADVAEAVIKAFSLESSGGQYIIANENLSYREFYRKLLDVTGQKSILIPLPDIILRAAGLAGDLFRTLGAETEVSSVNMRLLMVKNYYSNVRARHHLGIDFTPVEKAIADAAAFFRSELM